MKSYMQFEADAIDPQSELYYEVRTSFANVNFPHRHDYYELAFLEEGSFVHIDERGEYMVEQGSLILVQPFIYHAKRADKPFRLLQIAFPRKTFQDMVQYLGDGLNWTELLQQGPVSIQPLTADQQRRAVSRFEDVMNTDYSNKALVRTKLRILLVTLLTDYFFQADRQMRQRRNRDSWLQNAMHAMLCKENFTEGVDALVRLSGCSHEHLCRVMKDTMGVTPTAYINGLRLNYAEALLLHTDIPVLDICYDCGFNNLGYFYRVFKKRYGSSPQKFRDTFHQKKEMDQVSHMVAKEVVEKLEKKT